ncbi:hypothetical protein PHLGIDRAFT_253429 [Phlebiopsis gigantea 11061_1 CR5-6]|uniref:Uncharacterized protein n=1 Tax=Phlebiopsis gigantea (strain 11061_1 CR5-6) TaxID=745531 RepID=A0A0C3NET0_PHLG1|nr:hypothetical protein PHLGIDRAFT_253429 [Phlebiopsis gigantea 11061_1 CR5-6]
MTAMVSRMYYVKSTRSTFAEEFLAKVKARTTQRKKARLARQKAMANRRAKPDAPTTQPVQEAQTTGPKPVQANVIEEDCKSFTFPRRCFYPPPPAPKATPPSPPAHPPTPPPTPLEPEAAAPSHWPVLSFLATPRGIPLWVDYYETWPPVIDLNDDSDLSEDEGDAEVLAQMMQVQCHVRDADSDEDWD